MDGRILSLAAGILLCCPTARGDQLPVTATTTETPPTIDGDIQQGEWAGATRFGNFVQFEPHQGQPATQPTDGYFFYDDSHVYFGVYAYDDAPGTITARNTQRDGLINVNKRDITLSDDSIFIFLDTFHDRQTCYFFGVNPLSTQTDGTVQDNGRVSDTNWDAPWEVATKLQPDGWSAEFSIPLKSVLFASGDKRIWGINIIRARRSNLETSIWQGPISTLFQVSQYGQLRGLSLQGGGAKPYQFIPYQLGRIEQDGATQGDVGLDLRYTFRPQTTANLTVNPDFATVEADDEFVNLTRFEAFLPEKRPFFLEINERFRQRIQTFYSRRIEDIDVGGTLLSRNGPWDIAVLSARSRRVPRSRDFGPGRSPPDNSDLLGANYTVARVGRQLFGASTVGVMMSNRSFNNENRGAVGADTTLVFTPTVNLTGQLIRSHGPYKNGNWAGFVRPEYQSSRSHAHLRYTHLGDRFADNVNDIGFISDDNRDEFDSDLSRIFWSEGAVQRVFAESKNNVYWGTDGTLRGYHLQQRMQLEFRNRWSFDTTHRKEFRLFEKGFHNDTFNYLLGYNTREFQSWQVGYEHGRLFDSDFEAVTAILRRKPTTKLTLEYQLSRVWLDPDPGNQATIINVFRVRQNFTRDLFLRVFFQTNSVIDRKNTEAVFVWRYKPPFGTVQFVYQRGRAEFGQASEQGNTYFLKLTQVF